jgi:hypothetical protein
MRFLTVSFLDVIILVIMLFFLGFWNVGFVGVCWHLIRRKDDVFLKLLKKSNQDFIF